MERSFPRDLTALARLVDFTGEFFAHEGVPDDARFPIDFAIEEIFTNCLKYQPGARGEIRVVLLRRAGEVTVIVEDRGVDRFDPTAVPGVDVAKPLDQRLPGGLGIHVTRRLMDRIEYEYSAEDRTSTITMTKLLGDHHVRGQAR